MSPSVPDRLIPEETPIVILAEGCFGAHVGVTANGVVHYGRWPMTAVIDSTKAGQTTDQAFPTPKQVPIVESLQVALTMTPKPKALLLGTAPIGGDLPADFRVVVEQAITAGLHIINGLHVFLNEIPEIKALAEQHQVKLWDVREVTTPHLCTQQTPRPANVNVITMVGSDCSVGKMFTALELDNALRAVGERSAFIATGQTGIMISGDGIPFDRVICDFMAGSLEYVIDQAIAEKKPDWVIVEGQGTVIHPAYSGVTLGLVHGSSPDAMILCHNPKRQAINKYESVKIPPLSELAHIYETVAGWIKPAKVLGISLNTSAFSESEALAFVEAAEKNTGLPATDPLRFGMEKLVNALRNSFSS